MSWSLFLQTNDGSILVLSFFMAIIVLSFIIKLSVLLIRPNSYNPSDNKILGGLAVLMVAIIADIGWIYVLSLFIAGLLIASERFMLLLAAVINSDRTNVHKIPSYWYGPEKLYDGQELVETIDNSTEDTDTIKKGKKSKSISKNITQSDTKNETSDKKRKKFIEYMQKLADIDALVINKLRSRASYKYQLKTNVVVKVSNATMKYDAIYVEPETNQIKGAFEIKHFPVMQTMNVKAYFGNRAKKYLSDDFIVGFILVFNNYDHDELDIIIRFIEEFEALNPQAFITMYQIEDNSLTTLYEKSLKKAFPTSLDLFDF